MPPEILRTSGDLTFTEKSDVWSFGVTIYEVYSLGYQPYFNRKQIQDVIDYLCIEKGTLEVPDSCPDNVSDILKRCWSSEPQDRYSFEEILSILILGKKNLSSSAHLPKSNGNKEQTDGVTGNGSGSNKSVQFHSDNQDLSLNIEDQNNPSLGNGSGTPLQPPSSNENPDMNPALCSASCWSKRMKVGISTLLISAIVFAVIGTTVLITIGTYVQD